MIFAIYALLCGEKFSQKLCPWRKNDKYEVCGDCVDDKHNNGYCGLNYEDRDENTKDGPRLWSGGNAKHLLDLSNQDSHRNVTNEAPVLHLRASLRRLMKKDSKDPTKPTPLLFSPL